MSKNIRHSIVYGVRDGGVDQEDLFNGSLYGGFPDIDIITRDPRLQSQTKESPRDAQLGDPASFTGYPYGEKLKTGRPYCMGMRRIQKANKICNCGQMVISRTEDLIRGDAFFSEVLAFPYVSTEEIRTSINKYTEPEEILERPCVQELSSAVCIKDLDASRRRMLAVIAAALMNNIRVILKLPVNGDYEQASLRWLQEIFTLIPARDRCEIAFATAKKEADVQYFRDFNLVLSDQDLRYEAKMNELVLSSDTELSEEGMDQLIGSINTRADKEQIMGDARLFYSGKWAEECPIASNEVGTEYSTLDDGGSVKRSLEADMGVIRKFCDPILLWWDDKPEQRFGGLIEVETERNTNPTLSVKTYLNKFLDRMREYFTQKPLDLSDDGVIRFDQAKDTWVGSGVEDLIFEYLRAKLTEEDLEAPNFVEKTVKMITEKFGHLGISDDQWPAWEAGFKEDLKVYQAIYSIR